MIGELLLRMPRNTFRAEFYRSRMLHVEAYLSVVTATFTKEIGSMECSGLSVVSDVVKCIRSWEVLGVVMPLVKVNTAPPRTTAVTGFIRDQGCVEIVAVTHMRASFIYKYIILCYALVCAWSRRRWKYDEMIWVIMIDVCIIPGACGYVLLRIRPNNDGALYRGPETTVYRICSSRLYGVVSNETWAVIVPQKYYFPNTCCRVTLKISLTLSTVLVSRPLSTLAPPVHRNSLNVMSEEFCMVLRSGWTACAYGLGYVFLREHYEECRECHGDGNHIIVVECVWAFMVDGEALAGTATASMVYDKIMRVWRWHEPGEGSKSDELADVQSMDEMTLHSYSSTIFTNMATVLCHLTITLYMVVENLSQPCLAIFWGLSVIEIILIVMPMLYKLHFHSQMYHPWSSTCTCGDDAGREAVL